MAWPKSISKKNPFNFLKCFAALFLIGLTACTTHGPTPFSTQRVITKAQQQGFVLKRYVTQTFLLTAYEKTPAESVKTSFVYIEGDGNSWKTRYKLSDNPTPKQPLALTLAIQDPHPHVIYLARPCQYTPIQEDIHCHPKYWSSHRYAAEVVASMNEVLDHVKKSSQNANFVLVGFSGGASIAVLLAAKRQDIIGLVTVAGDLNHESLNKFHHTTPLNGSLNPSQFAHLVKHIPQRHLNGSKDTIVPTWVAQNFAKKTNHSRCVEVVTLKGAGHHKGWEENWADLINRPLTCGNFPKG